MENALLRALCKRFKMKIQHEEITGTWRCCSSSGPGTASASVCPQGLAWDAEEAPKDQEPALAPWDALWGDVAGVGPRGGVCTQRDLRSASGELLGGSHRVSPFSQAPSKTSAVNDVQLSCDVTASERSAYDQGGARAGESSRMLRLGLMPLLSRG